MKVDNHFNEPVEVSHLKRMGSPTKYILKACLMNGQTEWWNYGDFMNYNRGFNWEEDNG